MDQITQNLKKPLGKRGQTNIVNLFIVLIIVGALGLVSVLVHSKLSSAINQDSFTAGENSTVAQIKTNTLDSYELGSTGMIILAVSAIIVIIGGLGAAFGRR